MERLRVDTDVRGGGELDGERGRRVGECNFAGGWGGTTEWHLLEIFQGEVRVDLGEEDSFSRSIVARDEAPQWAEVIGLRHRSFHAGWEAGAWRGRTVGSRNFQREVIDALCKAEGYIMFNDGLTSPRENGQWQSTRMQKGTLVQRDSSSDGFVPSLC